MFQTKTTTEPLYNSRPYLSVNTIELCYTLYPVEFKKTATPSKIGSNNFSVLEKLKKKIGHGAVFCFVEKDIPLSKNVTAVPVGYL